MAVLRSTRLWATSIFPSAQIVQTLPDGTDRPRPAELSSGAPRAATTVFTCPAGKRAIIRTMQTTLNQSLPNTAGNGHSFQMILRVSGGPALNVRWFWWWEFFPPTSDNPNYWAHQILEDTWNGQLVMNPGDSIEMANLTPITLQQQATGALVDLPA